MTPPSIKRETWENIKSNINKRTGQTVGSIVINCNYMTWQNMISWSHSSWTNDSYSWSLVEQGWHESVPIGSKGQSVSTAHSHGLLVEKMRCIFSNHAAIKQLASVGRFLLMVPILLIFQHLVQSLSSKRSWLRRCKRQPACLLSAHKGWSGEGDHSDVFLPSLCCCSCLFKSDCDRWQPWQLWLW